MRIFKRTLLRPAAIWLIAVTATCGAANSGNFYVHPSDTVVFYGDSITEQRLYTVFTELYAVTRFPKLNATFVHSGWGGDKVSGGGGGPIDVRLERDVFAYKPTVMTIMLGMNDGKYANHTPADDDAFYEGYRHIVETVRQKFSALRITAIEPSPFDDVTRPLTLQPNGYNAVLVNYGEWIRHYAPQAHIDIADLDSGVVSMLRKANSTDPATAQKIIPDRVHPAAAGHLIMAEQLLKGWNARPIVAAVTIDAAKGKVVQSEFAHITDFHGGQPFVWTETDDALPLPFAAMLAADRDHTVALAIQSSDVTQQLNQEPLSITGLSPGRYKVSIDGETVGTWSSDELARGVNLAVLDTPMARQAMDVRNLTSQHVDLHQFRWRTIQVPLGDAEAPHYDEALKALDELESDVVARQRAAAQPRPHVFQVVVAE
ncbi:MAG: SGNH/GDSL hydrolase family protein [Acidobacteriaceae bacterium]|nr:SGNH/GDSL hydrolase family protein [Acidobacteriaceae bacterium]